MAPSQLPPDRVLVWSAVAATGVVVAATVLWATKRSIDQYIPPKYQYRPGTISGWLADCLAAYSRTRRKRKPIRVYMDGCFDMMHYGHANALRQARACGDVLVVGLVPDSEILANKGPPVLNDEERLTMVESVKWVDEVLPGVPYDLDPAFLTELFTKHKIDYVIHGDDPCVLPDGSDAYGHAKKMGRFRMIKRTEGVSTTDIVGRMLMCSRVNRFVGNKEHEGPHPLAHSFSRHESAMDVDDDSDALSKSPGTSSSFKRASSQVTISKFLPTSRRLVQFSNGRVAADNATIVYIDGAFDVFHPGHVKILKEARQQGDFLLVGLHTDEAVMDRRGPHLPIMSLHERSLSVLACKYVDEVVIGAPTILTDDVLTTFNISLVVRGSLSETSALGPAEISRYAAAQQRGIFRELPSPSSMTTRTIIHRIVGNRAAYEERNARKVKSEAAYHASKQYVQES